MKDEKKRTIKEYLLMIIVGIIINLLCLFIYKCTAYASSNSSSDYPLPYIVTNENTTGWEDIVNCFYYNNNYNWAYQQIQNENYFGYDFYENGNHEFAFYFPSEDFEYSIALSNNDYELFDMTINSMEMSFTNFTYIKGYAEYYAPRGVWYFYGQYQNAKQTYTENVRFFVGSNKGNGNLLVPNLASQNYLYEDDEYQVVFGFGNPERPTVPTGHATAPNNNINNPVFTNGHNPPVTVPPSLTINNYTWTTPPQLDFSSVIDGIETIGHILNWISDNLKGEFENLIDNIVSLGNFIGDTIVYYGGLILDSFKDLQDFLYKNFVSLFENIGNTISAIYDLITEPLNTSLLNNQLNNSSFISAYRGTKKEITSFFGEFSNISQPENVVFEIDLTGLWLDMGVSYIDFSIINPVLPYIRLVLGAILLYELIVTIVTGIKNH